MIPSTNTLFGESVATITQPSRNYKMNFEKKTISGYVDELEAMKQVIFKILNTGRYQYRIYSWNYGILLVDLFGKATSYVCPELERRIAEALLQDNRIESVGNFTFDIVGKKTVCVEFLVKTIFGELKTEWEVNLDV
ncbi:MAG: DUF2634 domain-containing protein [Bacillota bacterium]